MKGHLYRVTVEHLEDPKGNAVVADPLSFQARNHDDLLPIVARMRARGMFEPDEAAALAIGLKLFGEVMLRNREHELFAPLQPHFAEFIKRLKKS
jgi:Domain of Unknown Function with PDB structure (DUF3861)